MKKFMASLLALFLVTFCSAQIRKSINLFSSLNTSNNLNETKIEDFSTYSLIDIAKVKHLELLNEQPEAISIQLNIDKSWSLILNKTKLFSADAKFRITKEFGVEEILVSPKAVFYSGIIEGQEQSIACLSIFENEVHLFFSNESDNYTIGKIDRINDSSLGNYIFFKDKAVESRNRLQPCGVKDTLGFIDLEYINQFNKKERGVFVNECPWNIFFDVDYSLYQNQGNNYGSCYNMVYTCFNIVKTIFANENIDLNCNDLHIWTVEDPFDNSDSRMALKQFADYWKARHYGGNFAHLLKDGNYGDLGGRGYYSDGCNNETHYAVDGNIGWPKAYPNFTHGISTICHELGHNMGSHHTHWCGWPGGSIDNCTEPEPESGNACTAGPPPVNGGTIMSYCGGYPLSNGFGPLPGNVIRENASNKHCNCGTLEYVGVSNEGFICRTKQDIPQVIDFENCEPVWVYPHLKCISNGFKLEIKQVYSFADGGVYNDEWEQTYNSDYNYVRWYSIFNDDWNVWPIGSHNVKTYLKYNGEYQQLDSRNFNINFPAAGTLCGTKVYLSGDNSTLDHSGNNTSITRSGSLSFTYDRANNCNAAIAISNGSYLESHPINERAISFWFKMINPDQMVIYDGGSNDKKTYNWLVGIYKPNGLGANSTFDNSYGLYFTTNGHDFAVPYDQIQSGWHHVSISRDVWNTQSILIMIDRQVIPTWYLSPRTNTWSLNNYPFELDYEWELCTFQNADLDHKSFIGKEGNNLKIYNNGLSHFNGILDEFKIYTQLLTYEEMLAVYDEVSNPYNASIELLNPGSICEGSEIRLRAMADGATGFSWSGPNNFSATTSNPIISNASLKMAGIYTVSINLGDGCSIAKSIDVEILPALTASINFTAQICPNSNNGSIQLSSISGTAPFQFLWSHGANSDFLENLAAGTYSVTITDANGCSNNFSANINEYNEMAVNFESFHGENTCSVTANIQNGIPPYSYQWSNGQSSQTAINLPQGDFSVTVTDSKLCSNVFFGNCNPTTSIYDEEISQIKIYPNPTSGIITLENLPTNLGFLITIRDLNGKILTKSFGSKINKHIMSIDHFPIGIYVLHYVSKNLEFKTKIIKL